MKRIISVSAIVMSVILLAGCVVHRLPVTGDATEIRIVEKNKPCDFTVVYDSASDEFSSVDVKRLVNAFDEKYGIDIPSIPSFQPARTFEILVGVARTSAQKKAFRALEDNEYIIMADYDSSSGKVCIMLGYRTYYTRAAVIHRFIEEILTPEKAVVPIDLEIKGTYDLENVLVTTDVINFRDPSVIVTEDAYYMYGTGWSCYKNTGDLLTGEWVKLRNVVTVPSDAQSHKWAPEVHYYNGNYYMFTTYLSKTTGYRGCTVLKSASPEGPFVEISKGTALVENGEGGYDEVAMGHITPTDADRIDGTFYVDPEGQPWMIYVDEWVSTPDGVGRMSAAKLSEDLSEFISEPVELFSAGETGWSGVITDGCFMYTTEDGQLLMLWSSSDGYGYSEGIARSEAGNVLGPWTHDQVRLYSKRFVGKDGGHGMIFYDRDGQMYMSLHSPNEGEEHVCFLKLREENNTLVWDIDYRDQQPAQE